MDPGKYIALGTIIGTIIASITLCINNWLQGRRERKKWITDKMEKACLECLKLLSESRRIPRTIDDEKHLERKNYLGFISGMIHVPAHMAMMQCYSSEESAKKIEKHREAISNTLTVLKTGEQEVVYHEKKNFIRVGGILDQIEAALPDVIDCFQRELEDVRPVQFRNIRATVMECLQGNLPDVRIGRFCKAKTKVGWESNPLNFSDEELARVKKAADLSSLEPFEFIRRVVREALTNGGNSGDTTHDS